jgi:hypothetical protein
MASDHLAKEEYLGLLLTAVTLIAFTHPRILLVSKSQIKFLPAMQGEGSKVGMSFGPISMGSTILQNYDIVTSTSLYTPQLLVPQK